MVAATCQIQRFNGLRVASRPERRFMPNQVMTSRSRHSVKTQAGYIGSPTNIIMVTSTALCLVAGRLGLAPSTNKPASAGLNLSEVPSGLQTGDPAGFNAVDVLAHGSFGHILGAGIILGLRSIGAL